eukprot:5838973-Ditylum_brightwellii.AAC.1
MDEEFLHSNRVIQFDQINGKGSGNNGTSAIIYFYVKLNIPNVPRLSQKKSYTKESTSGKNHEMFKNINRYINLPKAQKTKAELLKLI